MSLVKYTHVSRFQVISQSNRNDDAVKIFKVAEFHTASPGSIFFAHISFNISSNREKSIFIFFLECLFYLCYLENKRFMMLHF